MFDSSIFVKKCGPWKNGALLNWLTVLHTFLSALAYTACTDMVYSKELERDVTTTAWRRRYCAWKLWYLFFHRTCSVDFFYIRRTIKGCHVHDMCKLLLFWAKTGKTSANFLRLDIKPKKSRSLFDLVTVLISKQSLSPTPATKQTEQCDKENSWIWLELCLWLIQHHHHIQIVLK